MVVYHISSFILSAMCFFFIQVSPFNHSLIFAIVNSMAMNTLVDTSCCTHVNFSCCTYANFSYSQEQNCWLTKDDKLQAFILNCVLPWFSSVQFSCSFMSDSSQPHGPHGYINLNSYWQCLKKRSSGIISTPTFCIARFFFHFCQLDEY